MGRQHEASRGADEVGRLLARAGEAEAWAAAGRHAAAGRAWRELAAALLRRGAVADATTVQLALARHLLERGHPAEAERAGTASVAAQVCRASALTDLGRLTAAEASCVEAIDCADLGPAVRARAVAALVRVLLWQSRLDQAGLVAETLEPDRAYDAFVTATLVRLHLARGEVFAAGLRARMEASDAADARAVTGVVRATTQLRLCVAAGDIEAAIQRCAHVRGLAARAHLPLRALRAQIVCLHGLRRAGHPDAPRLAARIARFEQRVPPLLAQAVVEVCGREMVHREATSSPRPPPHEAAAIRPETTCRLAIEIVEATRLADDRAALTSATECLARGLEARPAEVWLQTASARALVGCAGGGPPTSLVAAAIERGAALSAQGRGDGAEIAVPIRDGRRLLGAIAARVPPARSDAAMAVLAYCAVAIAPRLAGLVPAHDDSEAARLMPELVGVSAALADLRRSAIKAAAAPFTVLVEGESGVGKELVARALHRLGPRQPGPFRDLNCAALPEELLDSELFGHTRGAFTGALTDRRGLIEEADGGTLFLDEVADLSVRGQAKLLRVLQEREVRRVGEARARPVDVRVVTAANRDLRALAASGGFRPDLLYRLDVIRLRIPPLRARPEDVVPLAKHFWADASARVGTTAVLTREVLDALASHGWPGNVRELQNVVAGLAVAAPTRGEVRLAHLALHVDAAILCPRLSDARARFERGMVRDALARAGGNRAHAARALGVTRQGLAKLVARLRIDMPVKP
jgi:DNA-binding NtrC family response regulator